MPAIRRILFPFDFSRQGSLAAPFVRAIAGRCGAGVTLLSVVPPAWNTISAEIPVLVDLEEEGKERDLKLRLKKVADEQFRGLTVEAVTAVGDPALKIVKYAHAHQMDLIMLPTHGFGVFRSMLIGSVTAKALHDADCPVWTATHAEEQRSPPLPRTVLCAVDGTSETIALMQWAAGFTKTLGAELRLFHVVPPVSDWLAIPSERELQEQMRTEARAQLGSQLKQASVDAPLRVAVGKITDAIAEEARREEADLIVIGRGSANASMGRLRSHTYGIVRQSPCPVLSV